MKNTIFYLLLLSSSLAFSQKIKVKTLAKMPNSLIETSGLLSGTNNTVWTHNDSGGKPYLYKINKKAKIIRKIYIEGAKNVDWEEMANDYKGYAYIGDIGNNRNMRRDLTIYKIQHPDSLTTDTIKPQIITFSYPNQTAFPPPRNAQNFDAEALIAYEDSLFIFTKNRTKPYSCYTYIYSLKNEAGKQPTTLTDSIYLAKTHKYRSWVTGAAKHPTKDDVVLISHKKAWIIKDFRTERTLIKSKISAKFSQTEGICFDINGKVWISNESYKQSKAKLKYGYIKNWQ